MNEEVAHAQAALAFGSFSPADNSLLPRGSVLSFPYCPFSLAFSNPYAIPDFNLYANPSTVAFSNPIPYSSPHTDPFAYSRAF